MKNKKLVAFSAFALASSFSVFSCGGDAGGGGVPEQEFTFIPYLVVGGQRVERETLYMGENAFISYDEIASGDVARTYVYELLDDSDEQYLTVDRDDGTITLVSPTPEGYPIYVSVTELESYESKSLTIKVESSADLADGGYNFTTSPSDRGEALGALEGFAMKNFLTGISLFENGGYVRYSDRFSLGSDEYIPGYGFGLMAEGYPNPDPSFEPGFNEDVSFFHSASSSHPKNLNLWEATGSEISSYAGMITSSYFGTRKYTGDDPSKELTYEWYPLLATNSCKEPIPLKYNEETHEYEEVTSETEASTGSYKKWRIYVKTDKDPDNSYKKLRYHRAGSGLIYTDENHPQGLVTIEDYEFAIKLLLTGASELFRGTELAGDTAYGFKGAYSYNKSTKPYKDASQEGLIDNAWETFKSNGGFNTGFTTGKGDYLEFEFINPLDRFNAKYNLSSNLYSPLPQAFVKGLNSSQSWAVNAKKLYGFKDDGGSLANRVLCLGPYYLRDFETQKIVFEKSVLDKTAATKEPSWWECDQNRYRIPGFYYRIYEGATPKELYTRFSSNREFDTTSIPQGVTPTGTDKKAKGDSTFKLNVNSCNQEQWNALFGEDSKHYDPVVGTRTVNPLMSNKNFLKGIFWSINRKKFADARNVDAKFDYFSDAYLIDPNGDNQTDPKLHGASYNASDYHKDAVSDFFGFDYDSIDVSTEAGRNIKYYGYSLDMAVGYFKAAVAQLVREEKIHYGPSSKDPEVRHVNIEWMYSTDIEEYGVDIARDIVTAFNNPDVSGGKIRLEINTTEDQHATPNNWQAVYNEYLMKGNFDLGFGAISGNQLNPLGFLEVLKSDNSSGFTLNWGADTAVPDKSNPIVFKGEEWTFDSLWAAADHGTVVADGRPKDIVQEGYIESYSDLDGNNSDNLFFGEKLVLTFKFLDVSQGVKFSIDRLQLYLVGAGIVELTKDVHYVYDEEKGEITLTLDAAFVALINKQIFDNNEGLQDELNKCSKQEKDDYAEVCTYRDRVVDPLDEYTKADFEAQVAEWKTTSAGEKKYENYEKVSAIKEKLRMVNYGVYDVGGWFIEVYYDVKINNSDPVQSSYTILKSRYDQDNQN